ncbi:autoinducer binding domain-containing protein [Marinomonas shanghaiensis]|uniref:helix-turn-helix transcriptional regulator n=1 Tax=Marinomonas shanghaiensis TaxID=2202418 RepID=UPI003A8D4990
MIFSASKNSIFINYKMNDMHDDMVNDLKASLEVLGVDKFSYFYSSKNHDVKPDIITNLSSEWLYEYEEKSLFKSDPVLKYARNTILPFSWNTKEVNQSNNPTGISALKYGILEGYTFITVSHNKDVGILTVCGVENNSIINKIKRQKALIQFKLLEYHELHGTKKNIENSFLKNDYKPLSLREREVLMWAGRGKCYSSIATILGISTRTVKFHMSNIKIKLCADNAKQAISIAYEIGCLNI